MIVPPPVYERCRLAVRTASFALVAGALERREGVINVLASTVERLCDAPTGVGAEVRHIEPPAEPRDRARRGPRTAGGRSLAARRAPRPTASAGADDAACKIALQNICSVRDRS